MDELPQHNCKAVGIHLMVVMLLLTLSQSDSAVKLPPKGKVMMSFLIRHQPNGKLINVQSFKELISTSGAIQRYVPVSAVIISVKDSSLARPKSASLTVL